MNGVAEIKNDLKRDEILLVPSTEITSFFLARSVSLVRLLLSVIPFCPLRKK